MSCVIDLASRRKTPTALKCLYHPSGINLPFDKQSDAHLIIPEVRSAICTGAYSAGITGLLADVVQPGDRVLVLGAGLGLVSTLVAKSPGVERVIAIEANTELAPYIERTHALNGVPWVETVNAVLADGRMGGAPFFSRSDIRTSSLLPEDGPWIKPMLVPGIDLNLILIEEQISLVICDIPGASAQLLAWAGLGLVDRILINSGDNPAEKDQVGKEVCPLLAVKGFAAENHGDITLFERQGTEAWPVILNAV
jgi:FkbM family methyltransferase